jgi:hypothetical protein
LLPPNGSFASGLPERFSSLSVGTSYVVLPMAVRLIDRIAAESAYSGRNTKLLEVAPSFVLPPCATNSVFVDVFRAIPLAAWFSSERGRPRTRSSFCHDEPFHVRREMMPEFVSRFVSVLFTPPPMRGSLDPT